MSFESAKFSEKRRGDARSTHCAVIRRATTLEQVENSFTTLESLAVLLVHVHNNGLNGVEAGHIALLRRVQTLGTQSTRAQQNSENKTHLKYRDQKCLSSDLGVKLRRLVSKDEQLRTQVVSPGKPQAEMSHAET